MHKRKAPREFAKGVHAFFALPLFDKKSLSRPILGHYLRRAYYTISSTTSTTYFRGDRYYVLPYQHAGLSVPARNQIILANIRHHGHSTPLNSTVPPSIRIYHIPQSKFDVVMSHRLLQMWRMWVFSLSALPKTACSDRSYSTECGMNGWRRRGRDPARNAECRASYMPPYQRLIATSDKGFPAAAIDHNVINSPHLKTTKSVR